MGFFFGLILKWGFVSLEQSFQIHSYISLLGLNSHQFTFHVFNRWGFFAAHLVFGISTVTSLHWVTATCGSAVGLSLEKEGSHMDISGHL